MTCIHSSNTLSFASCGMSTISVVLWPLSGKLRVSHPHPHPHPHTTHLHVPVRISCKAKSSIQGSLAAALVLGHHFTSVPIFFTSRSPPMSVNPKLVLPLSWCNTVLRRHLSGLGLHFPPCFASRVSHGLVLIWGR